MSKVILLSATLAPLALALWAASFRKPRRGLLWLLVSVSLFDVAYAVVLYYLYLRVS